MNTYPTDAARDAVAELCNTANLPISDEDTEVPPASMDAQKVHLTADSEHRSELGTAQRTLKQKLDDHVEDQDVVVSSSGISHTDGGRLEVTLTVRCK